MALVASFELRLQVDDLVYAGVFPKQCVRTEGLLW